MITTLIIFATTIYILTVGCALTQRLQGPQFSRWSYNSGVVFTTLAFIAAHLSLEN